MNLCFTLGEYDFVAIIDMPNKESMVKVLIKIGKQDIPLKPSKPGLTQNS